MTAPSPAVDAHALSHNLKGKSEEGTERSLALVAPAAELETPAVCGINEKHMEIAKRRYELIQPALQHGQPYRDIVKSTAVRNNVGISTLYRWIALYEVSRDIASLLPNPAKTRSPRVSADARDIIEATFYEYYATKQRPRMSAAVTEVLYRCFKCGISAPHRTTIRKYLQRIRAAIGERTFLTLRGERKKAEDRYSLRDGTFASHNAPWFRVQIDHTLLNIIVVDEVHRLPVCRPYITIAVDSFSRDILGFYISDDPSGRLSTGLCLLHAMLPKDEWLKQHNVPNPWPCFGKPHVLHFDNGKEFLSRWMRRLCDRYEIQLEHRPVADPHFGPHVERLIGTLNGFLRTRKGATFDNVPDRGEYDSCKEAVFTLSELEGLVTEWITGTYRVSFHKGLKRTPRAAYEEGVYGTSGTLGSGRRILEYDQRKLRLDCMPFEERTIQHYGVTLNNITYSGESLAPYVHKTDSSGKTKRFRFHLDPRRIDVIYFYADDVDEFFPLTPREPLPRISLWEWRALLRKRQEDGLKEVDQAAIFESYGRIQEREAEAASKVKAARKNATRRLHHAKVAHLPAPGTINDDNIWDAEVEPY